jgi:hypothetical protein
MIRNRRDYPHIATLQLGYGRHTLFDKNTVIGPDVVGKKRGEDKNFHRMLI